MFHSERTHYISLAKPTRTRVHLRSMSSSLRVLSWNVNGLRACARAGFLDQLELLEADIFGLQEVRARSEQLDPELRSPAGWQTHFSSALRPGYSGVALYSKLQPSKIETSLDVEEFDAEGRVQLARFGRLLIANVYFPNGSGKARDHSRVPYKLAFYHRLFEVLQRRRKAGYRVLVMGDFNTAREDIDLARPKQNRKTSGFLPAETEDFATWFDAGWVDTFRHRHPEPGHYSWWSQRAGCRERNIGWRIDYVLATPAAMRYVSDAFILPQVMGSDHCPVGVELDSAILG